MENSEPANSNEPGPGEILRSAREALGISQREMADRLNWIPGYVAAIEENRFEVLRGAAFVRGYLRAYAKLVEVPEATLMAAYAALPSQDQAVGNKPRRVESRVPQVQKKGVAIPAGAALVVLVVFLLWYWRGDEQMGTVALTPTAIELNEIDTPQQAEALVQQQPAEVVLSPESSEGQVNAVDSDPVDDSSTPPPAAAVAVSTTAAAELSVPAVQANSGAAPDASDLTEPVPAESAAAGALQFRFSGDCWLEVRDAGGELIYADLRSEGDVLNLSGQAPFSILLGDASVVELDYLEQPVVIERRPGRVIATFSVGEE